VDDRSGGLGAALVPVSAPARRRDDGPVRNDGAARSARPAVRWAWRAAGLPAGALVALVFPESGLWWLAWVGLVPTLLLVAAAPDRGDAAWRSWAAGAGFALGLYHWILGVLGPLAPVVAAAMGATWIPVALLWWSCAARRSASTPRPGGQWMGGQALRSTTVALVVVPSAWVVTEFARSWHVLGGSWGVLGLSQWQVAPIRQLATLGGVWALSWLLVAANVGVALALCRGTPPTARLTSVAAPVVLALVALWWGAERELPEPAATLGVAGIQPGVVNGPERRLRANEELTDALDPAAEGIDLIVWGQSSVGFDPDENESVRDRLEAVARRAGVPVLVNIDARRSGGSIAKSSLLIDPARGIVDTYDKQRLVPFGEYVPLRSVFGWVGGFTEAAEEDRRPGDELTVFDVAGARVGPLISYESTFPDLRRSLARLDPQVVIVQGASTTFQGSWAQPQQAATDAIRAIESGRPSMLVAVSGTSSAFDGSGRRLAWLPADRTGVIRAELPLGAVDTLYVRWGDWVPVLSLVAVVSWVTARLVTRPPRPRARSWGSDRVRTFR